MEPIRLTPMEFRGELRLPIFLLSQNKIRRKEVRKNEKRRKEETRWEI